MKHGVPIVLDNTQVPSLGGDLAEEDHLFASYAPAIGGDLFARELRLAEGGDIESQFRVALAYATGAGIKKDWSSAEHWLGVAASSGHADAQFRLGLAFERGEGSSYPQCVTAEKDSTRATELFESAVSRWMKDAELNDAQAQYKVARAYLRGRGVPTAPEFAVEWWERAARLGHPEAQYELAVAYTFGRGVGLDRDQGVSWFTKAAQQGHVRAQAFLGRFSPEWRSKAIQQGCGSSRRSMYFERVRGESAWSTPMIGSESVSKFDGHLARAIEDNDADAMFMAGLACKFGFGTKTDITQAIEWWVSAAEAGHSEAALVLGWTLSGAGGDGWMIRPNLDLAKKWYRRAAESGSQDAVAWIAANCQDGTSASVSDKRAKKSDTPHSPSSFARYLAEANGRNTKVFLGLIDGNGEFQRVMLKCGNSEVVQLQASDGSTRERSCLEVRRVVCAFALVK